MAQFVGFEQINVFKQNVVIEEEAFSQAAAEFEELAAKIDSLLNEINEMMDDLKTGFDTPAGHKFIQACGNTLVDPLEKQKIVVTHISENLNKARTMYQSVFDEYREVVNSMNE